jgi:hypothetical protein
MQNRLQPTEIGEQTMSIDKSKWKFEDIPGHRAIRSTDNTDVVTEIGKQVGELHDVILKLRRRKKIESLLSSEEKP